MDAPCRRRDARRPSSSVSSVCCRATWLRRGSASARPAALLRPVRRAPRGLTHRRTGVLYGAIAAAVLLALGYLGTERLQGTKPSVPSAASIAVLPLANESGDASQQYFSDGISEDLITALSQFPGLKVIGRSFGLHVQRLQRGQPQHRCEARGGAPLRGERAEVRGYDPGERRAHQHR